jgi:hypothetical protein
MSEFVFIGFSLKRYLRICICETVVVCSLAALVSSYSRLVSGLFCFLFSGSFLFSSFCTDIFDSGSRSLLPHSAEGKEMSQDSPSSSVQPEFWDWEITLRTKRASAVVAKFTVLPGYFPFTVGKDSFACVTGRVDQISNDFDPSARYRRKLA